MIFNREFRFNLCISHLVDKRGIYVHSDYVILSLDRLLNSDQVGVCRGLILTQKISLLVIHVVFDVKVKLREVIAGQEAEPSQLRCGIVKFYHAFAVHPGLVDSYRGSVDKVNAQVSVSILSVVVQSEGSVHKRVGVGAGKESLVGTDSGLYQLYCIEVVVFVGNLERQGCLGEQMIQGKKYLGRCGMTLVGA